ncbi:MAG: glycosyl transferase family 1, partial [Marinilabiliales bacterium]
MKKIIIIGPAHPLRGGIAAFNERLANALLEEGHQVHIETFKLQYPNFLFPGKTQYSDSPEPDNLNIDVTINSVNPFNWIKIGRKLKKMNADLAIVAFWLPFMGPCLGKICSIIKRNRKTKIVSLTHNLIPHEKRPGDGLFIRYFGKKADAFLAMSKSVLKDIETTFPSAKSSYS